MDNNKIKQLLNDELKLQHLYVKSNNKYIQIIAVGDIFNGLSHVNKQKIIYAPLMKYIANNTIHAISIQTYTNNEWVNINNK
ncbi:MAG: BolA/IbaG family iron-sulfur metabolism protein [Pantoea sp. Brub]|nr:BolA/IbaG family iron-sulfur metabolism protein [Pantoea sp. Brub]